MSLGIRAGHQSANCQPLTDKILYNRNILHANEQSCNGKEINTRFSDGALNLRGERKQGMSHECRSFPTCLVRLNQPELASFECQLQKESHSPYHPLCIIAPFPKTRRMVDCVGDICKMLELTCPHSFSGRHRENSKARSRKNGR